MYAFAVDKEGDLPNLIPSEKGKGRKCKILFKDISNDSIFIRQEPRQAELNVFLDAFKKKVILDYQNPSFCEEN